MWILHPAAPVNPTVSIACCINVYQDAPALRGLLETAAPYFDNIFVVHSGPQGARSTDGTIELCEQYGATIVFDDIQRGFGNIRTRAIHDCGCTFGMLLDADERFHPHLPVMHCEGDESYPEVKEPNLSTFNREEICNQGELLKSLIRDPSIMAVRSTRRHWFDFNRRKPTQNWLKNRDYQLRIVRNSPHIYYRGEIRMHERIVDDRTGMEPHHHKCDEYQGPFHDHYHMHFRRTQPGKKEANERNYGLLERGEPMEIPA